MSEPEESWYCVRCLVKREHIAATIIRERVGVDVFAPRITYRKNTARGRVRFTEALFPGYLFARFNLGRDLRHISAAQGVTGVVRYGQTHPSLPDEALAELRRSLPVENYERPDPVIEVGSEVIVTEGPLRELSAVVTKVLPARDRVRVLLDFLGRQAEVEVSRQAVSPRNDDPKADFFR